MACFSALKREGEGVREGGFLEVDTRDCLFGGPEAKEGGGGCCFQQRSGNERHAADKEADGLGSLELTG